MLKLKNLPSKLKKTITRSSSPSHQHQTAVSDHSSQSISYKDSIIIDDSSRSIECELLKIYDVCQNLPAERRRSSFIKKKSVPNAADNEFLCCSDQSSEIPPSSPYSWPQRPILLRPSPDSGMKVLGVRYSSSTEYLPLHKSGYCDRCTLPINNGYEQPGQCLVIDFETELFSGTLLLRLKNISSPLPDGAEDISSYATSDEPINENFYFNKRKRSFQATVKGRFKKANIPASECITGQSFNRPAGYLPPRLIVKGAVSIISRLAPQLQARLEGDCPRFLSPLVSTAQTVLVNEISNNTSTVNLLSNESIEEHISEPQATDKSSMIQSIISSGTGESIGMQTPPPENNSPSSRVKVRKRAFDKIFAAHIKTPTFHLDKEYTFEFFQHLITFDDFCLDFVKPIGKHSLHNMLNGQPLKFMAAHQTVDEQEEEELKWLWCFDLWHESLYEDALSALEEECTNYTVSTQQH